MILTLVLLLLALIHLYWLFGETGINQAIPTNEQGDRLLNPGKFMTFVVALVLFGFAWVSYILDVKPHSEWIETIGWVLALLFCLRAIGDFKIVGIFKKIKNTEFAKYDTRLYIPLCFLISLGDCERTQSQTL